MKRKLPFCALLAVVLLMPEQAQAIPAFARKYNMSCSTCHQPFPRLKAYADEFAGNGFQLEGNEPPRAFRETGDDQLLLMRDLPLAVRVEGFARWLPQHGAGEGTSDWELPYVLKILSGGQIARDVSYYFYFLLGERGEIAGLEDAFVMFNNVGGSGLDLTVGQFQVSDPLFKGELRLTLEPYTVYGSAPGSSLANLKYDRGVMVNYGFSSGTDLVLEVVNGAGIGAMNGGVFDRDRYKNFVFRVSQEIGEHIRIGGIGYLGNEEQNGRKNSLWMAGPDLTVALGPVEVNLQYVARKDENPYFLSASTEVTTKGGFAEMIYLPDGDKSRWYGALLYNGVDSDDTALKYETASAHFGLLLARNLRAVAEYTYDFQVKANQLSVGLVSAF